MNAIYINFDFFKPQFVENLYNKWSSDPFIGGGNLLNLFQGDWKIHCRTALEVFGLDSSNLSPKYGIIC